MNAPKLDLFDYLTELSIIKFCIFLIKERINHIQNGELQIECNEIK